MPQPDRRILISYGLTFALVALAALIRLALTPWLGHDMPFVVFIFPLLVAGFYFGWGPSLLVTAAGAVLGTFFSLGAPDGAPYRTFGVGIFIMLGLFVSIASWMLERSKALAAQANQRATQANLHKDRFLAVLGHELRNPLNGIALGAEILERQSVGNPKHSDLAQMILRQARLMQKLIDDMLEISRIEQGKVKLVCTEVQLQEVIATCVEQQVAAMQKNAQTLQLHLPPAPVVVWGDQPRLIQVLANLLTNASKYSGPHSHIDVLLSQGTQVELVVKDNGRGIAADKLPLLFEPFMQINPASEHAEGGLGLGLPTAKRLAELHGGTLQAFSSGPGQGAAFTLRLPLRGAPLLGPSQA